ncbi:hypothetical protein Pcinc_001421 [Petrolisthes cinctipes]|uniref:Uncharacterized protein n=1 Tax=Petrolisthes cinctipes TaxID=88211 RepID=A0AAE1L3X7_PETCI|nr:hypothetical protein Pcinc_001421 [Petrolisthes cinctipes]
MPPGTGYLQVKERLLCLGAGVSSLDSALFFWDNAGTVEGIICVYVDDFLWAGTQNFERQVIEPVNKTIMVGSSESKAFRYVGLNIISEADGSMTLDQFRYASSLMPITISRQRAMMKTGELSESEKTEYRALIGQLNWIATHTSPDITFDMFSRRTSLMRECRGRETADRHCGIAGHVGEEGE